MLVNNILHVSIDQYVYTSQVKIYWLFRSNFKKNLLDWKIYNQLANFVVSYIFSFLEYDIEWNIIIFILINDYVIIIILFQRDVYMKMLN